MISNKETYTCPDRACQETVIKDVRLATAYVPFQEFCPLWPPLVSLERGTAFPELFSPYKKREYVHLEPEKCRMDDKGRCRHE